MSSTLHRIANTPLFQNFILGVIVFAGVLVGLETSPTLMARYGGLLHVLNNVVLWIFVAELLIKLGACGFSLKKFFSDPWNIFDFLIVAVAFLPIHAEYVAVIRLARLLRFMRLIHALPRLQILVGALLKAVPSMGYVALLLGVLFYVYGILAISLFGQNDPMHFKDLPTAMLTLFGCATGEAWVDVMYTQMYGCSVYGYGDFPERCVDSQAQPVLGALFFVSFMLIGAMVMLNLFIGVIMSGMEETAKENAELDRERAQGDDIDLAELEGQLAEIQEKLAKFRLGHSR
jgi:voltage-gated sodium channel